MPDDPLSVRRWPMTPPPPAGARGPSAHVAGFSGAAPSPRSWHSGTRSSSAASCSRAPGRSGPLLPLSCASSAGCVSSPRASGISSRGSSWIYTPRAHNDGTVDQIIEEVLAFPHKQSAEDLQRSVDVCLDHDTTDRLPEIAVPTLVLAGGRDPSRRRARPRRRRADPRRPVRGAGGGGPPTLPGDPGRVERPRRRLLARGRLGG